MTREEIDSLWFQAMHESIRASEEVTRYRFAELVAAAERSKQARGWRTTTRRDVLRMAHHSGFSTLREDSIFMEPLENFARFVAEIEREACAKVCDAVAKQMDDEGEGPTGYILWVKDCANAIRARGKE